jgi:hypothetical protein
MSELVLRAVHALGEALQQLLSVLVGPARARLSEAAQRGRDGLRSRLHAVRGSVPPRAYRPAYFVLTVLAGALLLVLRRIDSALQQMHLLGASGGGALGFPLRLGPSDAVVAVEARRTAWQDYLNAVSGTRVLAAPQTLVRHLVLLDLVFIGVYGVLLAALLLRLISVNATLTDRFATARRRLLIADAFGLALLVAVDVLEDLLVLLAFGPAGWDVAAAIGPAVSALKFLITALIAVPMLLTVIAVLVGRAPVRQAVLSARAVLVELGVLVAVLLVFGIGKNQTDDVVRAWTSGQGVIALVAGVAAALVVTGATAHLTGTASDHPRPGRRRGPAAAGARHRRGPAVRRAGDAPARPRMGPSGARRAAGPAVAGGPAAHRPARVAGGGRATRGRPARRAGRTRTRTAIRRRKPCFGAARCGIRGRMA